MILVGHDMGLMAQFVDRLGVMYAGQLVEVSPVRDIFTQPLHPYTQMLIASLPSLEQKETFRGIPGLPPPLLRPCHQGVCSIRAARMPSSAVRPKRPFSEKSGRMPGPRATYCKEGAPLNGAPAPTQSRQGDR